MFDHFDSLEWMRMRQVNKHFKAAVEMTVLRRNEELTKAKDELTKEYNLDNDKMAKALKFSTNIMERLDNIRAEMLLVDQKQL